MSELTDRVAYALFRDDLLGLPEDVIAAAWGAESPPKERAERAANVAVETVKAWQRAPNTPIANDVPQSPPISVSEAAGRMFKKLNEPNPSPLPETSRRPHDAPSAGPLRFPQRAGTLSSVQRPERGAVAGHPGWFWWEQRQPPNGVMVDYRRETAMHISHRVPSSQSPVSLVGLMWKLSE